MRAVPLWSPDAVLVGRAAAAASFWPGIRVGAVEVAAHSRSTRAPGFRLNQRLIPPELIRQDRGLRYTAPALTALDLCSSVGGDGIDTALRTRAATLDDLHVALALTGGRVGNLHRRRLLVESRHEPWSAAERLCHQLLHQGGVTGWKANFPVPSLGSVYYIDVAFEAEKVALEVDGRLHEDDPGIFESDRWRQNYLVLQGWRVLRYTWSMLQDHPEQILQDLGEALRPPQSGSRLGVALPLSVPTEGADELEPDSEWPAGTEDRCRGRGLQPGVSRAPITAEKGRYLARPSS